VQLPSDLAAKVEGKLTLTPRETAELVGVSLPTLYAAIRSGQLPSLRFGERAVRIPVGALLAACGFSEPESERTAAAVPSTPNPVVPLARKEHRDHTATL
jgi:excisionase family DNA binding protein